jgi:hypothetical protein
MTYLLVMRLHAPPPRYDILQNLGVMAPVSKSYVDQNLFMSSRLPSSTQLFSVHRTASRKEPFSMELGPIAEPFCRRYCLISITLEIQLEASCQEGQYISYQLSWGKNMTTMLQDWVLVSRLRVLKSYCIRLASSMRCMVCEIMRDGRMNSKQIAWSSHNLTWKGSRRKRRRVPTAVFVFVVCYPPTILTSPFPH